MRTLGFWLVAVVALAARAAERKFDFSQFPVNTPPAGFRSAVAGEGRPGDWRVILDEVAPLLTPLTDKAPAAAKRAVLAQLARDPTDEHFPLLIFEEETFTDFTFSTRFKTVAGEREQMAGVIFRAQNERSFYVLRASSLGNTLRFYKVVDGQRGPPIGPQQEIARGVWHELAVECKGNQIRCLFNGREALPPLTDNSFSRGKVGFWTKSDSVSYFADARVTYTAAEPLAQKLVRSALDRYPRLRDLKMYALTGQPPAVRVVAARSPADLGQAGGAAEAAVIARGEPYYLKGRGVVSVWLPLRDRNGEPIAAVRVTMESFPGQTEQNALIRALPVLKHMQAGVTTREELLP